VALMGVKREPNPWHRVQICERGKFTQRPQSGMDSLAVDVLGRWRSCRSSRQENRQDQRLALRPDHGEWESHSQGEGQQLN